MASGSRLRRHAKIAVESVKCATVAVDANARTFGRQMVALASLVVMAGCAPPSAPPGPLPSATEWQEFQGTWTAVGNRNALRLGADRRASIAEFDGTLLLAGPARPGVGFRAEALVFNDSATGMIGRAVWTDERGDEVYSELRGEGTATGNKIVGTFLGGTGRYSGATGTYEFSWRFVLESEEGNVQGQSEGLTGRVRVSSAPVALNEGGQRP